jgi:hypothetical protein
VLRCIGHEVRHESMGDLWLVRARSRDFRTGQAAHMEKSPSTMI